jgi:hypothetical protein
MHLQIYTEHPFIDIYAAKCDKGMAFDSVTSKLVDIKGWHQRQIHYIWEIQKMTVLHLERLLFQLAFVLIVD